MPALFRLVAPLAMWLVACGGDSRPAGQDGGTDALAAIADARGNQEAPAAADASTNLDGGPNADGSAMDRGAPDVVTGSDAATVRACADDRRPAGFCDDATATPCALTTGATCRCTPRCTGVLPPPGMTHEYVCALPPPAACPSGAPKQGDPCPGMVTCTYGTCALTIARCEGGTWRLTIVPPPP